MKLDKAIKRLTTAAKHPCPAEPLDFGDALKLGIKALKQIKEQRTGYEVFAPDLLPGETEE